MVLPPLDPPTAVERLAALVDRLRPAGPGDDPSARVARVCAELSADPAGTEALAAALWSLLALPDQGRFYAESGVRSALGFWLELVDRAGHRAFPAPADEAQLRDLLHRVFTDPDDHRWVARVPEDRWLELARLLRPRDEALAAAAVDNMVGAARLLTYRLAGTALDREVLRAAPALGFQDSPFLTQNVALVPLLDRWRAGERPPVEALAPAADALDACAAAVRDIRGRVAEVGVSVRLTYQLARLDELNARLRLLVGLLVARRRAERGVWVFQELLRSEQSRARLSSFVGENVSLLARNVTEHARRRGEHYIAEDRAAWWAMARSAAGGGVIIATMATLKVQLALLHLPPLTAGVAYGLNYGLGFALIHLLGFTVATKQPAMTAATVAAALDAREDAAVVDLARAVARTQLVAVVGNVALAVPVGFGLAWASPRVVGRALAPPEKAVALVADLHPLLTGSLFYAAVAGVGLFLSGLVAGFFDNQVRYHRLAGRIAASPLGRRLGPARAARLAAAVDTHHGALLGNLFFGMYLGLAGVTGTLTGLAVDIRHVAFASANLGMVLGMPELGVERPTLAWAAGGVALIALVNLAVSFTLALWVALASRRRGLGDGLAVAGRVLARFARDPLGFVLPPPRR